MTLSFQVESLKLFFGLLVLVVNFVQAQNHCIVDSNYVPSLSKFVSTEITNQNGTFNLTLNLTTGDTFVLSNINVVFDSFFNLQANFIQKY